MDKDLFHKVKQYAIYKHRFQQYGSVPYFHHLVHVQQVLKDFGVTDEDILLAGWLHDAVEDTTATITEVEDLAGERVADIVYRVTDEEGKNRKERKAKTYLKIISSASALTIKLADRIANVETSLQSNLSHFKMYKKEHTEFKNQLYGVFKSNKVIEQMKTHLDSLLEN